MVRKLNIGMIGAGFIGQLAHLMNYVEIPRCRVLGIAEYRPELRRRVAARYEIPRTYATHQEMIADPEIEAVVVVTPRSYTGPVVLDCLAAGKHVISEKPMAGTSEQGRRLVDCAKANQLCYAVGYMKRYDEGVQAAKQIFDKVTADDSLGPLLYARAHCYVGNSYCNAGGHVVTEEKASYRDAGWPIAPDWLPEDWQKPYAVYLNTYSHNSNLLRYFFGRNPQVEFASLDAQRGHVAVLNFGNCIATLETGRASNRDWDEVTEFFFADGRLTIRTPPALLKNVPARVELYKAGAIQEVVSPQINWTWSFRRQAEAFVAAVLDGEPLSITGAEALEELRLVERIWRAEVERISRRAGQETRGAP